MSKRLRQTTLSFAPPARQVITHVEPLPVPSEEQKQIISALESGQCVSTAAVAGAGKTTTTLMAAMKLGVVTVLCTYTRALKVETEEKIKRHGLDKTVSVFTFHGLFRRMMKEHEKDPSVPKIMDDETLNKALKLWRKGKYLPMRVDAKLICIDEIQDLCPFYYECMQYVLPREPVLMFTVGDSKQMLYDFKSNELKANPMYIKEAPHYFSRYTGTHEWVHRSLARSYRLTPNVARFVNEVWCTDIVAGNTSSPNFPVEYWHLEGYANCTLVKRILKVFDEEGAESVLMLSQSTRKGVKAATPLELVINDLLQLKDEDGLRRFNFHMIEDENGEKCVTVEILKNKTRVWTYCTSKGTEATAVIVFGFYAYNLEVAQQQINQMGVALSRCSKRLIVIHGKSTAKRVTGYWPGMCREKLWQLIREGVVKMHPDDVPPFDNEVDVSIAKKSLAPSGLKYMSPESVGFLLEPFISVASTSTLKDARAVKMASSGRFTTGAMPTTEDFGGLVGCAIPFALEHRTTKRISMIERILNIIQLRGENNYTCDAFETILQRHNLSPQVVKDVSNPLFWSDRVPVRYLKGSDIIGAMEHVQFKNHFGREVCFCDTKTYDTIFAPHIKKIRDVYNDLNETSRPADFVFLANASQAFGHSHHLWRQIGSDYEAYDRWVDQAGFQDGLDNLERMTDAAHTFECPVTRNIHPSFVKGGGEYVAFNARVDCVGKNDRVYEFKFKDGITDADRVQALLGAALLALREQGDRTTALLNFKTGEMWETPVPLDKASLFVSMVESEFYKQ